MAQPLTLDQLDPVGSLSAADVVAIVQGGATYRTTVAAFINDAASFTPSGMGAVSISVQDALQHLVYDAAGFGSKLLSTPGADINLAITAANTAGGGIVFVPLGTYTLETPVVMKSNVTLMGAGRGTILKQTSDASCITGTSVTNIVVRDLQVLGDADVLKTSQRGVQWISVTDSLVHNVYAKNTSYDGILLLSGCVGCTVSDCHVDGAGDDGINIGGDNSTATTDTTVTGNVVENCTHDGIHVSDGSLRTTVTGNVVMACNNGVSFFKTNKVTVTGNTIYNCTLYGIDTPSGPNADIAIVGNVIDSCARGMVFANTSRYSIVGNVIRSCTAYGIVVSEGTPADEDAIISDNLITGGITTDAILLSGAKDVVVNANQIVSITGAGIVVAASSGFECTNISITNNLLRSVGGIGIQGASGTGTTHITIRGNHLSSITGRCIEYKSGAYFDISDNRCISSSDFPIVVSAPSLTSAFGIVERNKIIGGGSSGGVSISSYSDVLVRDNVVTGITASTAFSIASGYRNIVENNLTDKTITGGVQSNVKLEDHFLGDVIADQWNTVVGTDPQCVAFAIFASQPRGVIRGTTGDDAADTMAVNGTQLDSQLNWKASNGGLVFECRMTLNSITNVAFFMGLTDQAGTLEMPFTYSGTTLTSNASDAVGVLFDTDATTDNWKLVGVAADVDATVQDAGVAPVAGTFELWRIELTTAGNATFYRNGSAIGSVMTGAVTAGTLLTPVLAGFSHTTSSKNFDVDWIRVTGNM